METEQNKALVYCLVGEVVNQRNLDALDEVAAGAFARTARRWISPFRQSFPDFRMEIVELIAQGDRVVAHFRCSGTHQGEWLGYPPTGKRFEGWIRSTCSGWRTAGWRRPPRSRTISPGSASWVSGRSQMTADQAIADGIP